MMQEVEVLKTIPELVCSYFSEEQFTLSGRRDRLTVAEYDDKLKNNAHISQFFVGRLSYTEQTACEKSG